MKIKTTLKAALAGAAILSSCALSAQSFGVYLLPGDVLNDNSDVAPFGSGLNGFFTVVDSTTTLSFATPTIGVDPAELFQIVGPVESPFDYLPMVEATGFAGPGSYGTTADGSLINTSVGTKVVVVLTDAASVGAITAGSQIGVIETNALIDPNQAENFGFFAGNVSVLAGIPGSVTMTTVVPEPSTFALLGGVLALGFVMYRRRKA